MDRVFLSVPVDAHAGLLAHLLPGDDKAEQAAFVFVREEAKGSDVTFRLLEWFAVPQSGFLHRTEGYLELTDKTRGYVIKRAHDLDACLVEWHSHPYPWEAAFSPSDRAGLDEFVPHVRWRLRGKPYLAVVVAPGTFDALAWIGNAEVPRPISGIEVGERLLHPTGLSLERWSRGHGW